MWAENYWLFHDSSETLACVVNDIFEKLLGLDMEPKPESLYNKEEDGASLKVGIEVTTGVSFFSNVFDVLGYRFHRDGKGAQGIEKTLRGGLGPIEECPLKSKCHPVVSQVFSTALIHYAD